MAPDGQYHFSTAEVLARAKENPAGTVIAVIAGTEGPSYRPVGAMMAVLDDGSRVGALSSGCIEADVALHAKETAQTQQTRLLRYGTGSPFKDIELPCGGGLDILLIPAPGPDVLERALSFHQARQPVTLAIDMDLGRTTVSDEVRDTGREAQTLFVRLEPELRFLVFGKGPEALAFASLVQSVGYPNTLLAPDEETRHRAKEVGCSTYSLLSAELPGDVQVDARTAVVLFFHDHDWEPPILAAALDSQALYIGAQGSMNARRVRLAELTRLGCSEDALSRLSGPIGLVPSARDARTLAVSVLAEVLARAMDSAA